MILGINRKAKNELHKEAIANGDWEKAYNHARKGLAWYLNQFSIYLLVISQKCWVNLVVLKIIYRLFNR
tara:strand:+ start:4394 stop:4600 length:207 start_codon:yes stop_codon:yes gene_type:complete